MAIPIQAPISNPVTGVFGIGQVQFFNSSGTWYVPPGVAKVRVRMWGGGGGYTEVSGYYGAGGGGGFALKTIYDLTGITSVAVSVGAGGTHAATGTSLRVAGTSSFGSYCSATGGATNGANSSANIGGTGIGGDINNTGGRGYWDGATAYGGGGGCASLFGNGGIAYTTSVTAPSSGGAGAGAVTNSQTVFISGGSGFMTGGGVSISATGGTYMIPEAFQGVFSIDFIGTGGGGGYGQPGMNGGGGGYINGFGGYPGGGAGYIQQPNVPVGGNGLVIVEW